jgi:hypothetical protein
LAAHVLFSARGRIRPRLRDLFHKITVTGASRLTRPAQAVRRKQSHVERGGHVPLSNSFA